MVLVLTRSDLEKTLSMKDTILALEEAFREQTLGQAISPLRISLSLQDKQGWFGIMPCYLKGLMRFSTKIVSLYGNNPSAHNLPTIMATVVLNDPETGKVLSIMDGTFITSMRTGGLGGLAAKHLSRKDSRVIGIFGAGVQARTQLMAVREVREISLAKVYDPIAERAEKFKRDMQSQLGIPIEIVADPKQLVRGSDIITTVSTSKEPVLDGSNLEEGAFVGAFGNFRPNERELDSETVRRSRIVVDSREAALEESGDLLIPMKEGVITADNIVADLGEVILGRKTVRRSDKDIVLFKSVGLAIQDCAASALAYQKARELGIGTEVELQK